MNKKIDEYLATIKTGPVDLTIYKKHLRTNRISHDQIARYTGRTRETITLWLLGRLVPPARVSQHIASELEQLILINQTEEKQQ